MFAWLISADRVVILCDSSEARLFYNGKVYIRPADDGFEDLPMHKRMGYGSIWALIDVDYRNRAPAISSDSYRIWPIQTTSPNPDPWKAWSKQNGATLLGMPPWNVEELMGGSAFSLFSLLSSASAMSFDRGSSSLTVLRLCYSLHLHPQYNSFRSRLEQSLLLPDASTLSITNDKAIDAALEVLRESGKAVEAEKNEDKNMAEETGNEDTAHETGNEDTVDEDMVGEAGKPLTPVDTVDDALKILVHNAIEEFGLPPVTCTAASSNFIMQGIDTPVR